MHAEFYLQKFECGGVEYQAVWEYFFPDNQDENYMWALICVCIDGDRKIDSPVIEEYARNHHSFCQMERIKDSKRLEKLLDASSNIH